MLKITSEIKWTFACFKTWIFALNTLFSVDGHQVLSDKNLSYIPFYINIGFVSNIIFNTSQELAKYDDDANLCVA